MSFPEPNDLNTPVPQSIESLVFLTHVIYALHAFAVVSGIIGSVTILGSFVASLPSIVAVILNYVKRGNVRGTWLESHFRWQIRTFWFAMLGFLMGWVLVFSIVGFIFGFVILGLASLWVVYRVARGWWRLGERLPMPLPPEV